MCIDIVYTDRFFGPHGVRLQAAMYLEFINKHAGWNGKSSKVCTHNFNQLDVEHCFAVKSP